MPKSPLSLFGFLKSRNFLPAFLLFVVFVAASAVFSVHSQSNEPEDTTALTADSTPTPTPTPHTLVGTFYTTENNIEAKLLLNNKGITMLEVRPTLYNLQGQELQLPSVWVEPQNFRFINLRDWAMIGGDSFKSGSIKLFHVGKDLVLGSQIYLTDEAHSVSYEEKLAEIGKFDSRRQEAVWQIPTAQTSTVIALSNTSNAPLTVNGRLGKAPQVSGVVNTFQLTAHETKVLDVRRDFSDGSQFFNSELMALSLTHNGANKDALLARVLVADPTRGFSNVVQFSNPAGGASSEYQGVGFQIENINNQILTPVIVARNVGTSTATVSAKVPYTRTDGTKGTITLPTKQLAAGEIGALNVSSITQRVQQEQIKVASLEVTYNTAAGSVIVAAHTVSADKNLVFRVPMWDPLGQRSPTGGYPWRIENTSQTETYIKNITDQEQDYVAFLVWENNGMYMIGRKPIAGHETVHIDVKKIRDEQIPDERGRTVPTWISSGQLQWTLRRKDSLPDDDARANLALMGRSEQVDVTKKIVNNYACQNCCTGNFTNGYLEAANPTQTFDALEVQGSRVYFAVEESETCYGGVYSTTSTDAVYNATWASSDSNVATVNSGGNVTGVNAGNVQISATWRAQNSIVNPCPPGGGGGPQFARDAEEKQCDTTNPDIKQEPSPTKEMGDGKTDEPIDAPNIAACGSCQSHHFNFTARVNLQVVLGIQKIQYQEPNTSNYIDITGNLFVLKGTSVTFKAIPRPANATFPSGQPTWSGTSGATGTGQTISVAFNTKSSSTTDYKTVVANTNNGTPVTVNVVVFELTGTLNPQDYFYGRSTTNFGLLEKIDLGFITSPSVTTQQLGTLRWTINQGTGSVTNNANLNGSGIFNADRVSGSVRLALGIESGPSKGATVLSDIISVVAPSGAYIVKNPDIPVLHCQNYSSVGFQGFVYLTPKDVSFSNLYFKEGLGTTQASGFYQRQNGLTHDPTDLGYPVNSCNLITGCEAFYDTVYTLNWTGPFAVGTLILPIEWKYGFVDTDPIQSYIQFTTGIDIATTDNQGTANTSKAGSGTFTKTVSEITSRSRSLDPCIYPVVNP